jgi:hypothetical protein
VRLRFVDLEEAKIHLRITALDGSFDAEVEQLIPLASAVVFDYLKAELPEVVEFSPPEESPPSDPAEIVVVEDVWPSIVHQELVRCATLLALGDLFEQREATPERSRFSTVGEHVLTKTVKDILHRMRDPALA